MIIPFRLARERLGGLGGVCPDGRRQGRIAEDWLLAAGISKAYSTTRFQTTSSSSSSRGAYTMTASSERATPSQTIEWSSAHPR